MMSILTCLSLRLLITPFWLDKTLDAGAQLVLQSPGVIYRDITSIYCLDRRSLYVAGCCQNMRDGGVRNLINSLVVSVEEAASLLGVHPETVRREIRRGRLPAVRIGRRTLVAREVLNRLLSGATS